MGGVTQGERRNQMNYQGAMGPLAFLLFQNPRRSIPVLADGARPTRLVTDTGTTHPTRRRGSRRSQPQPQPNGDSRDKFYP